MLRKDILKYSGGIGELLIALENKELTGKARLALKALRPMNLRYSYALRKLFADKKAISFIPPVEQIAEPVVETTTQP